MSSCIIGLRKRSGRIHGTEGAGEGDRAGRIRREEASREGCDGGRGGREGGAGCRCCVGGGGEYSVVVECCVGYRIAQVAAAAGDARVERAAAAAWAEAGDAV